MNSIELRQAFIDFFKSKQHTFVPAAPVIPENDPTLLFTNAGMNQFKPYFLGAESPAYKRVVNSQPCIRVSGKHNDLEDVGRDTYHHTSFEMLGNWSFGDYYKKDAIIWAWELLTEVYKLPKEHLFATVYEDDEEAAELWRQVTDINHNHIVKCGKKDNFWEMGATGPCGPCSEIHLDLTPDAGPQIERDPVTGGLSGRYMELWNLVFIQYDRQADESLLDLPDKHIDTGAGLERLAAQLQGVDSNYDTDCFSLIIKQIESELGINYSNGLEGMPHRVISDHIRTVAFGISDNVLPSNEGRGYVLRRLIRRALRFASQAGKNEPFLYRLIPIVNDSLGGHFPNITKRMDYISELVKAEETQFLKTLSSGLNMFTGIVDTLKTNHESTVSGETAFKLYDTYGFPFDLTQVLAEENHLSVDEESFKQYLSAQRERSRSAREESLDSGIDDSIEVLSNTVEDVQHGVYIDQPGGGEARIPANNEQRFGIAQHHTGTHLLHEALRHFLGDNVQQAGSLVDVNRLRFDFTYHQAISKDSLAKIESFVNDIIQQSHNVIVAEDDLEAAKDRGAHAMFGEKYGDRVRVVEIPEISIELCGGNHVFNTIHLQALKIVSESAVAAGTRRIEAIVGNERIAAFNEDIRQKHLAEYNKRYKSAESKANGHPLPKQLPNSASVTDIINATDELTKVLKDIEKKERQSQQSQAGHLLTELESSAIPLTFNNSMGVFKYLDGLAIPVLRDLSDRLLSKMKDGLIVFISVDANKANAIVKVSNSLVGNITAKDVITELTSITGGGGGGRDNMAQAGGLNPSKCQAGIDHLIETYAQTTTRH
ncbi:MAG: alanine--tRNA ligase [Candidatus Margulisiibacteriota bacterium]|nr:alanine--tRNA ligase [Candidatus Margulisiibacteriota bacterium]